MVSVAFSFTAAGSVLHTPQHFASKCTKPNAYQMRPAPTFMQWRMKFSAGNVFKDVLLEKVRPLNFGRTVFDDKLQQEEIEVLISQVEATNRSTTPFTNPSLTGTWYTLYTTSKSILGIGKPSFLQSTEIVQELNIPELTARNTETFQIGPLRLTNAVEAALTPISVNRVDVKFLRFVIFGLFKIDVEKNENLRGWLDVTYLDEDLRISRGSEGNVFVLVKT